MIINIRGTHGSGKSTIVRKIMARYLNKHEIRKDGRKRPLGYLLNQPVGGRGEELFIPGHYETACGGCDTISEVEETYNLIWAHASTRDVLFEGILAQHYGQDKFARLHEEFSLTVIVLTTSLEECVASVNLRRAELGKEPIASTENIAKEHRGVTSGAAKLRGRGLRVHHYDRFQAEDYVLGALGFAPLEKPNAEVD